LPPQAHGFATAGARLQPQHSILIDHDTHPIAVTRWDGRSRPSIRSRLKRYLGVVVDLQNRLCFLAADARISAAACGESEGKHKQRNLSLYCEATDIVTQPGLFLLPAADVTEAHHQQPHPSML
jgi:hypothetical protein